MSHYTTQLRWFIEQFSEGQNIALEQKIEIGRPHLFDFNYPIFDDNYKKTLETNIINNYYMKEIGLETFALFKHYLRSKLLLIMPYYNKLYESALIEFDAMTNYNYTETLNKTGSNKNEGSNTLHSVIESEGSGESESVTNSSSSSTNLESDLPQANFNGLDYGTTQNETNGNGNSTTNDTSSQNSNNKQDSLSNFISNNDTYENYVLHRTGAQGIDFPNQLLKLRDTFLNVDELIINDLKSLFMTIY